MRNLTCAVLLAASLLFAGGCGRDQAGPAPTPTQPTTVKEPSPAAPVSAEAALRGIVAERLDVPSYTYLRLQTSQGDVWAAVPTNPVAVGAEVTILGPVPMRQFESKALKRTFDVVMFGSGVQVGGAPASGPSAPHASQPDPKVDLDKIQVARAAGANAHTVAEIFAQSRSLKDKKVSVRGKVVKVTSGVMARNFLHLRDGSGTDADKNNDLVVTTTDEVKVDNEVTATGVVHTDKDFGSGYFYPVLLEDATVK